MTLFADVSKLRVLRRGHLELSGWVLSPVTRADRHRGDHKKKEAETGAMWPQAKKHLESPEGGRGKKGLSP